MRTARAQVALALASGLLSVTASAVIPDNIYRVVSKELAVGSFGFATTDYAAISTFGYDPINHAIYLGSTGSKPAKDIRRVDNVDDANQANQVATRLVYGDPSWLAWARVSPDNGQGSPLPFGLLLNPKKIGSIEPYTKAWIFDQAAVVQVGPTKVEHPELTKRLYQYDLQYDANSDASDNFTTVYTLQDIKTAAGAASNTMSAARSYTWSGDGQSVYWFDQGSGATAYGGLWKASAAVGGTAQRLIVGTFAAAGSCEPAVLTSGGVDTLITTGHGTNAGGLDKVVLDGVNAATFATVVSPGAMADFLELPSSTLAFRELSADSAGNVYFTNTTAGAGTLDRKGTYRLDPQGRLSRVLSHADRSDLAVGLAMSDTDPTADTLRMQINDATYTNGATSFTIPRILYADSDGDMVVGVWAFKPGDFNRDNTVDQSDIQSTSFKTLLTARAAHTVVTSLNRRFDLNGNGEVTWKDVKILQSFYSFLDGDANIDQVVDSQDFDAFIANYGKTTGAVWTQGDFTGDDKVNTLDFNLLAGNFGQTPPALPGASLGSVVPEPTVFSALAFGSMVFAKRRLRTR